MASILNFSFSKSLGLIAFCLFFTACGGSSDDSSSSSDSSLSSSSSSSSSSSASSSSSSSSASSSSSSNGIIIADLDLGEDIYLNQCAQCHQEDGQGTSIFPSVTGQCEDTNCQDQLQLSGYVAANMPPPGSSCDAECAANVAAYIIEVLQAENTTPTANAGSWNLDLSLCGDALSSESQRLLPQQILAAIEDVFNVDISATASDTVSADVEFPDADPSAHFSTSVGANRIARGDIRLIADAADSIILSFLDSLPSIANCGDAVDDACAQTYIQTIAPNIYRGVYSDVDVQQLLDLYNSLRVGSTPLDESLALAGTLSSMIQSPAFLYLLEIGTATGNQNQRQLTAREIANRMAFLLTNRPPDSTLIQAANNGSLNDGIGRRNEAQRIIAASDSSYLQSFFAEWLGVTHVVLEDRVSDALGSAFEAEFDHIVNQTINQNDELGSLFSRNTTFVNQTLADYYGLSVDTGDSWTEVSVPSERTGGLLTTALVATAHSSLGGTSVIQRGHFVREDLLCYDLGSPPPGATDLNPVLPPTATVREQIDARGEVDGCGGCHQQMDPIGIGMEDMDDLGLFRTTYSLSGHPVDSDGMVASLLNDVSSNASSDQIFNGTAALGEVLSSSPAITMCAREQWFTYAMGSEDLSQCYAASLGEPSGSADGPIDLMLDLVESERFVLRTDNLQSANNDGGE